MTKTAEPHLKEAAVRKHAAALAKAITEAKAEGFVITWPNRPEGLDTIAISQTGTVRVVVEAPAGEGVDPATQAAAQRAAQKAAEKVVAGDEKKR